MKNIINFSNVNLHYSSSAYRETSLKSYVFNLCQRNSKKPKIIDIHALKNISLTIQPGERVALIGHNGAGKSTLLKAIAGLYPASSGKIFVQGKVRALFELTLGFEPEATGRENILYRGLLLGNTPKEIRSLEDEIISFADIGEFIDYPIKTYSAGMQVRLAFAISTMVAGDLLLLDEVLGAGDAAFMRKAKNKINELISKAEIMLLSSHDFSSLIELCNRGIVMQKGKIIYDGDVSSAITHYLKSISID